MRDQFQFPHYLTDLLLICGFSLFILWPGLLGYEAIQEAKYNSFLLLFGGYLVLMALFSVELMIARRIWPPSPMTLWKKASVVQRLVVAFWGLSGVSAILSPYASEVLVGMSRQEGFLTITIYCGCFLCVSVYGRIKPWMPYVFGGTMTVYSILCLLQLAGMNPLGLFPEGYSYLDANVAYSGIYLGTTGNADLVAALLCLTIPLLLVCALRGTDSKRFLLLIPAVLCLVVLWKLDVQAGLVGIVLGLVLSVPVVFPVSRKGKTKLWIGVGVLGVLALVAVWNTDSEWGVVYELSQILHGNWDETFGSGRIYIWQQVMEQIPNHLWFGTGPDTMSIGGIQGFAQDNGVTYIVDVAHNEYLNIWYHQGIFALVTYLAALILSAIKWVQSSGKSGLVAACGSGILCYSIQAFFGFSMCASAGLFWLVWAILEREHNLMGGNKHA